MDRKLEGRSEISEGIPIRVWSLPCSSPSFSSYFLIFLFLFNSLFIIRRLPALPACSLPASGTRKRSVRVPRRFYFSILFLLYLYCTEGCPEAVAHRLIIGPTSGGSQCSPALSFPTSFSSTRFPTRPCDWRHRRLDRWGCTRATSTLLGSTRWFLESYRR